jgi:hypothetical protein
MAGPTGCIVFAGCAAELCALGWTEGIAPASEAALSRLQPRLAIITTKNKNEPRC